jgi:peroxiredoxin
MHFFSKNHRLLSLLAACGFFALSARAEIPTAAVEVNPVEVGATAPDATLTRADGTSTTVHALVAEHPVVLVFYRGGWCPYCNRHLSALAEVEERLLEKGYSIHAVSADRPEKVAEVAEAAEFNYALYSDAEAEAAKAFGLAFKVDAATYKKLLGYGIDLEDASGNEHHLLPVPALFIIGSDARIRFRYYNPDYTERLSAESLLAAIEDSTME